MRIALIGPYPPNEIGPAKNLRDICQAIEGKHEFVVIADVSQDAAGRGENILGVWKKGFPYLRIIFKIAKIKPECVFVEHEFNMYGGQAAALFFPAFLLLCKLFSHRVCIHSHSPFDYRIITPEFCRDNYIAAPAFIVRNAFRLVNEAVCRIADRMMVHEEYFKELCIMYGANGKNVFVIPFLSQSFERIGKTEARKKLGLPKDAYVYLYFGFLASYKGLDEMLGLFERSEKKGKLLLVVGGPTKRLLKNRAYSGWLESFYSKCRATPSIKIIGFAREEDVPLYFNASDELLAPYKYRLSSSGPILYAKYLGLAVNAPAGTDIECLSREEFANLVRIFFA